MSKLVKAQVWIRRHFEPGSAITLQLLRPWCDGLTAHSQRSRRPGASKTHYAQVSPKMVSDAFHDAAAACGIAGVTFNEVRALSAYLYGKTHDIKTVQALMAHTSEKMTGHYQAGHEVDWTTIKIGIDI